MGLDWNPLGRPREGCETEFEQLFRELEGRAVPEVRSVWARLLHPRSLTRAETAERTARFRSISEPAYATLGAPRVGHDRMWTAGFGRRGHGLEVWF